MLLKADGKVKACLIVNEVKLSRYQTQGRTPDSPPSPLELTWPQAEKENQRPSTQSAHRPHLSGSSGSSAHAESSWEPESRIIRVTEKQQHPE